MKNAFDINGAAYTDMICSTTRKSAQEISKELGFEESYLKGIKKYNRVRISTANLIEKMYGVSVSPFIVLPKKPEPEAPAPDKIDFDSLAHGIAMEVAELVEERVLKFLELKLAEFGFAKEADAPETEESEVEASSCAEHSAPDHDLFLNDGIEYAKKIGLPLIMSYQSAVDTINNCYAYYDKRAWGRNGELADNYHPCLRYWLNDRRDRTAKWIWNKIISDTNNDIHSVCSQACDPIIKDHSFRVGFSNTTHLNIARSDEVYQPLQKKLESVCPGMKLEFYAVRSSQKPYQKAVSE
jgi:hypothetical protein